MIGIKGTGMSALAVNLKSMGIKISGSDFAESFFTDVLLAKHKVTISTPFEPTNLPPNTDLVIVSTAYNNKNVELQEAEKRGLKIMTYPQALGLITKKLKSVAVCGSHGKTTTSGILSYVLSKTDYQPIVNVGSIVPQLITYRASHPKLFVFEADEYQNKFQYFYPKIIILTNIDYDHPDYFKTTAQYKLTFQNFIKRIPRNGLLIYCIDDKTACDVAKNAKCKKISYGFSEYADCQIEIGNITPKKMSFRTHLGVGLLSRSPTPKGFDATEFQSKLIGHHNALNLTAAILCATYLKIRPIQIKQAIATFRGTKRRLEITKRLTINEHHCIIIDDFGHHPTEIKATIATLKTAYPNKTLWTVFQPHTFSRTEVLFNDFAKCFVQSDKTVVLDVYASKREIGGKIHSRDLVEVIRSKNLSRMKPRGLAAGSRFIRDVFYKPDLAQAADFLKKKINADSIILTIGASNVWELSKLL